MKYKYQGSILSTTLKPFDRQIRKTKPQSTIFIRKGNKKRAAAKKRKMQARRLAKVRMCGQCFTTLIEDVKSGFLDDTLNDRKKQRDLSFSRSYRGSQASSGWTSSKEKQPTLKCLPGTSHWERLSNWETPGRGNPGSYPFMDLLQPKKMKMCSNRPSHSTQTCQNSVKSHSIQTCKNSGKSHSTQTCQNSDDFDRELARCLKRFQNCIESDMIWKKKISKMAKFRAMMEFQQLNNKMKNLDQEVEKYMTVEKKKKRRRRRTLM